MKLGTFIERLDIAASLMFQSRTDTYEIVVRGDAPHSIYLRTYTAEGRLSTTRGIDKGFIHSTADEILDEVVRRILKDIP